MGKAAENEHIKLRATFYNNMAVGLMLIGALYPVLNVLPVISKFFADLIFGRAAWLLDSVEQALISLVVFVVTTRIAVVLRRAADQEIEKIQD
jgi:hypothetical protein